MILILVVEKDRRQLRDFGDYDYHEEWNWDRACYAHVDQRMDKETPLKDILNLFPRYKVRNAAVLNSWEQRLYVTCYMCGLCALPMLAFIRRAREMPHLCRLVGSNSPSLGIVRRW
jgi:hypothetical protein